MDSGIGYDIGNLACVGECGCGLEETGLIIPLGDVALDEFGALGGIISIMAITNKLNLYTYLLSSCSNFLPFSASGSPMQTLALFSDSC